MTTRHLTIAVAAVLSLAAGLLAGCATNPATGEPIFVGLSWQDEAALGAEAQPQFIEQSGGLVESEQAQAYVDRLGRRLLEGIEEGVPELEWEFHLLDTDDVNAFALPGGKVFFTRGLAARLDDEAEMAGVLGHEIGHVTARHGNQRITQANIANLGVQLAGAGIAVLAGSSENGQTISTVGEIVVPALSIGGNVVLLRYGRQQELEADMLGMRYMSRAGYDPAAQGDVMEVLASLSAGGGRPIEWLSTHPYPETRIDRIRELMATEYAGWSAPRGDGRFAQDYRTGLLRHFGTSSAAAGEGAAEVAGGVDAQRTGRVGVYGWCAHCVAEGTSG